LAIYFVMHPNMGVTALVDAPSTEKARTTFLDWLERSGQILRSDRQRWRKNMVAEKMDEPQSVTADVELSYGYDDSGSYLLRSSESSSLDRRLRSGSEFVESPSEDRPEELEYSLSGDNLTEEVPRDAEMPRVEESPRAAAASRVEKSPPSNLPPIQRIALGRQGPIV